MGDPKQGHNLYNEIPNCFNGIRNMNGVAVQPQPATYSFMSLRFRV